MRKYELLFFSDINDAVFQKAKDKVKSVIDAHKGEVYDEKDYEVRTLAYDVNDMRQGHYYLYRFTLDQAHLAAMERELKLDDSVTRFVIVNITEVEEKLAKQEAKKQKKG